MSDTPYMAPPARRAAIAILAVGLAGLAACVIGAFIDLTELLHAYLFAYVFYWGLALGCLAIAFTLLAVDARWGAVVRRLFEAGAGTLPVLGLLFVPIAVGARRLYPWADPGEVARSEHLQHKHAYLNVPFFAGRAALWFAAWIGLAYLLRRWSRQQDEDRSERLQGRLRALGSVGLVLLFPTVSFAAIDWIMSLMPDWYSTIFGMLVIGGQALSALAFTIIVAALLARRAPLDQLVAPRHLHNLGKLLLTFVMIWAYLAFSQWLLIWSGNLPEENVWYVERLRGGWQWVGLLLIVGHFALPFVLLLSRDLKRHGLSLGLVAGLVLAMRVVDQLWLTTPQFHEQGLAPRWTQPVAFVGLGGVWLAAFLWLLRRRPLVPLAAPALREELAQAEREKEGAP